MPGPAPDPHARRRNPPTIPTTSLPAGGRKGRPPNAPAAYNLGEAGKAWWRWAWGTPQAAAWDAGALYVIARRAQLEDDLAAVDKFDPDAIGEVLGLPPEAALDELATVLARLKGLAGGRLAILKEMRELDGRLGLTPKAMADLRWTIVAPAAAETAAAKASKRKKSPAASRRGRLTAVK